MISRREVLAFVALADAPMPDQIRFDYRRPGTLIVEVGSFAAADAWRAAFAVEFWGGDLPTEIWSKDGSPPYRSTTHYADEWRGWRVQIEAEDPVDAPLDDDTRAKLGEIAGEPK